MKHINGIISSNGVFHTNKYNKVEITHYIFYGEKGRNIQIMLHFSP